MNSEHFLSTRLQIGRLGVPARAMLAPMSGITDVVFRRIAARFGSGLVVTEMVASEALVGRSGEALLRAAGEGIGLHVVQLVGRDPAAMGEAARLSEAGGAHVIDLNFGCPAKKVVGGHGGSALMREPALACAIVAEVVAAVAVPVTVKMRLGWDRASLNAATLARDAVALGVQAITVHGRTRQDFYEGAADWRAIAEVVNAVPVPVVANGDVTSEPSAQACLAASGASAVMVGRGAVGQPWLVGQIARALTGGSGEPPPLAERADAIVEHYDGLLRLYGRDMGLRHARKHLAAYADRAAEAGHGLPEGERRELVVSTDPNAVLRLLARLYDTPCRIAA